MKRKQNTWHQLIDNKCPKCNGGLMKDLFGNDLEGCSCGFNIKQDVKELLVNRDQDNYVESKLQDK